MGKKLRRVVRKLYHIINKATKGRIDRELPMTPEERMAKYGLSDEEYRKQRYDLLDDKKLKMLMTKPKVSSKVDYVADRYGAPRGEVFAKALEFRDKYGLQFGVFASKDLYRAESEAEIRKAIEEEENERREKIATLADILGESFEEADKYVNDLHEEFGISLKAIIDNQLFKLNKSEIAEVIRKSDAENKAKKERIKKDNNWTNFDYERSRDLCRYRYNINNQKSYDNLKCWAYPVEVLDTFAVPADCYALQDTYDNAPTDVLNNKILFDQTFRDFLGRKFWVNKETTFDEFSEFIEGQSKVFCKPINLLGGHGCYIYELTDDPEKDYEHLINEPKMLIEEIPKQHHLVNEIYDKSINTVRIAAVIKDDKFVPFFSWMKFGAKGSIVDGRVGGGCFAGVNIETGIIETPAIDYENNRFEIHPDTGKPIRGFKIPYYKEALELAERALRHIDGIDFVGWDLCITENGPIIIEGNAHPAFAELQLLYNYEGHEGEGQRWRYIDLLEDPDKGRRVDD